MPLDAGWIAQAAQGDLVGANTPASGPVVTDSRECAPGSVYIARRGETVDGHQFVAAAREAGAAVAVVEELQPVDLPQVVVADATLALGDLARAHLAELRASGPIQVIGITGSAGKTTTKDLLGQILSAQAPTVFPRLSFNNEVGCPLTVLQAGADTRYLVLEMGASGPGHLRYLTNIAPLDVAVELLVGKAHLGGFGSVEALAEAKAELVEGLLPSGVALLNADDPRVAAMSAVAPGEVKYFAAAPPVGPEPALDEYIVWARDVVRGPGDCARFRLAGGLDGPTPSVELQISGTHQVSNAVAAAAAALAVGVPVQSIADQLSAAAPLSPHRMDVRSGLAAWGARDLTVVDDAYNANPDSMSAGLLAARQIAAGGRLVAVLGEMLELGEESASLHQQVAVAAEAAGADQVIGVGDKMRHLLDALPAGVGAASAADWQAGQALLAETLRTGDTVLLKGSHGSSVWRIADAFSDAQESAAPSESAGSAAATRVLEGSN